MYILYLYIYNIYYKFKYESYVIQVWSNDY